MVFFVQGPNISFEANREIFLVFILGWKLANFGIRVNAVAPGPVETDGAGSRLWPSKDIEERIRKGIPIKRFGRSEEIANSVCYLVSPYADFINGECLVLDGGEWLNKGI